MWMVVWCCILILERHGHQNKQCATYKSCALNKTGRYLLEKPAGFVEILLIRFMSLPVPDEYKLRHAHPIKFHWVVA